MHPMTSLQKDTDGIGKEKNVRGMHHFDKHAQI